MKLLKTPFPGMFTAQRTISSMNVGLKVTYLYHDVRIIEVRVTAENERFRGSADMYVGTDGLLEAAVALQGFPKDRRDKREIVFGSAGPKFAGGSVRLEFYCCWLRWNAATECSIMLPLAAFPMHYYPAARRNPILPFNSKRARLPNPAVRGGMATPVGATGSKVRFARYPTAMRDACFGQRPHGAKA